MELYPGFDVGVVVVVVVVVGAAAHHGHNAACVNKTGA